jgi:hypothetical protein
MQRPAVAILLGLLLPCAAFAVTPSKASLKGAYAFQMTTVQQVSWWKTVSATCFGHKYTVTLGDSTVDTVLMAGTATFNGAGGFSANFTEYGDFNEAASANTVSIACTSNPNQPYTTNSGHAIFYSPSTLAFTGTYTVASTGIGSMSVLDPNGTVVIDMSLGQFNSAGVSGVVLLRQVTREAGDASSGMAILK